MPAEQVRRLERSWVILVRSLAARHFAKEGLQLSVAQYYALHHIDERAPLRMGKLAKALRVAESTATRLVDRLVDLGLVARVTDAADRRAVGVVLTGGGRRLLARARRRRMRSMAELLERLEPVEREDLVRLFDKLAAAETTA